MKLGPPMPSGASERHLSKFIRLPFYEESFLYKMHDMSGNTQNDDAPLLPMNFVLEHFFLTSFTPTKFVI